MKMSFCNLKGFIKYLCSVFIFNVSMYIEIITNKYVTRLKIISFSFLLKSLSSKNNIRGKNES